jgi:UrcA family protein
MTRHGAAVVAVVLAVAAGVGNEAAAQLEDAAGWITVIAPRAVRQQVGRTAGGAQLEIISLTRHVSYADLDLAMYAHVLELEKRVNEMAQTACEQLAALYPLAETETPECVRQAAEGAMTQVRQVAAAASAPAP